MTQTFTQKHPSWSELFSKVERLFLNLRDSKYVRPNFFLHIYNMPALALHNPNEMGSGLYDVRASRPKSLSTTPTKHMKKLSKYSHKLFLQQLFFIIFHDVNFHALSVIFSRRKKWIS